MRRVLIGSLGLLLAAVVLGVWVIPFAVGPDVECIGVDPVTCEAEWRAVAEEHGSMWLPVTAARVSEGTKCPAVGVEWLWGIFAVGVMC